MTEDERSAKGDSGGSGLPNDETIARLMRLAGPRDPIPADVGERVHATAKREWRRAVARRRARRWAVPAALAASLVLALFVGTRIAPIDGARVATVVTAGSNAGRQATPLAPGDPVHAGDAISTGGRGVSLAFDNGLSLRLAAHTTATINDTDEVTVASGRIYADTGSSIRDERRITVHTEIGSATDHGTQFVVGYSGGAMTVAVREGSVAVSARHASYTTVAGEKLVLQPGQEAVRSELAPYDPAWNWAAALAPAFDIEGRAVSDFLAWAARETGRELVFASDSARLAARATYLSGTVSGLTPPEAIEAVRPTIPRFDVRVDDRRILVSLVR